MLINTRFAETNQIHYLAQPGGARQQLTFFSEPVSGGAYNPAAGQKGFLFSMDVGGAENYQLFYYDVAAGKHTLLTDGKSRNTGGRWSQNGKMVAFSSNLRNGRDFDLRLMSADKPGTSELLRESSGSWSVVDWSPDDQKLLVQHFVSANESYLYTMDAASKTLTPINPKKDQKIAYGSAAWSHDGKGIYYTSDELGEFQQLTYYDLDSGKKTMLTANLPWDVQGVEVSPDGSKLAYTANEDGIAKLHVLSLPEMKELALPALPVGLIYGLEFTTDGNELALGLNNSQTSGDVYSIDSKTSQLKRWTFSEIGGLNAESFVSPELIRYPTFDKVKGKPRMIPAFYYKPKNLDKKCAVIISIHGGPEGQAFPSFNGLYQYWLNEMGIAVLVPNVRGSSGYGKTYVAMDNGYKREESVKDIGALLDWIAQQPELDATRVGVYGGSYGGYMVLATMTNYNTRIKAGVDVVGISNFVTFLESTQEYRRDLRRVEYGDERDAKMREFLLKISPSTNASKITSPLFVVQGANDPRVPMSESDQIVKTVRGNGGEVWYLIAKDEGHGFQKKSNRDYFLNAMTLFWETQLLGNGTDSD
jgi:dipeptidyl aminopeptidase/acylaminoacyl peptidase